MTYRLFIYRSPGDEIRGASRHPVWRFVRNEDFDSYPDARTALTGHGVEGRVYGYVMDMSVEPCRQVALLTRGKLKQESGR